MGVRGLTTYIANHEKKYLKNFKLHSCYVIIDGNSLACQLFVKYASRAHCAFGGDYDRYAQRVREFFNMLSKCDVKSVVIFDGGYERRKVNTVISRMCERIAAMKHVKPCSQDSAIIFPLFLRIVFKQVLKEMNIPFVQCDFEADQEIASLAHKYNCPVLSYDSDFYIFDVDYIPIPLIEAEAAPLKFDIGQQSEKYCINCKMYKVDYFLESFGGLDKTMLPLLACFLGNDYVKIRAFKKFCSQFKTTKGKGNPLQKKIARLIEWLRNETFESAIEKVFGRMKRIKHRALNREVMKVINAYTRLNVTIESYLPSEFTSRVPVRKSEEIKNIDSKFLEVIESSNISDDMDVEMEEINSEDSDNENESEDSLSESENEDQYDELFDENVEKSNEDMDIEMIDQIKDDKVTVNKATVKFPEWLLISARKGNVESCITDILTLGTYFALPQIEETFCNTSHFISIPLIKIICKLLIGNYRQEISLWTKNEKGKVQKFLLHFLETKKIVELEEVPFLSNDQKKTLLLECLNIPPEFNLDSFPEDWKLYVCAIIYWIKNTPGPVVTECHLTSLCMCIVALNVIDVKVGYFRKKIAYFKKYGRLQKKILKRIELGFDEYNLDNETEQNEGLSSKIVAETSNVSTESKMIKQLFESISSEDCIAVYEEFYQFHQLDENLKINKSLFSIKDIHIFAQFQSCLYHIMLLNSLLLFPFKVPGISSLYSGTFIYNIFIAFNGFRNTSKYLESLLNYSPAIMNLIIHMCSEISKVAPVVVVQSELVKKSRRRKRKRTTKSDETEKIDDEDEIEQKNVEDSDDDNFYDANNAFSLLSSV